MNSLLEQRAQLLIEAEESKLRQLVCNAVPLQCQWAE